VPVYGNWPAGLEGQTIDNTEVFYLMEDYLEGGKAPQITDLLVSGITATGAAAQWNTTEPSDSQAVLSGSGGSFVNDVRVAAHTIFCTRPPAWHHLHADQRPPQTWPATPARPPPSSPHHGRSMRS